MISIIAAMDEKRGLGRNNQMAWNIPGELKIFKEITTPHPIIMGRKTFESIGRPLPNRTNIIISRDPSLYNRLVHYTQELIVCNSLELAIEKAKNSIGSDEIFIIGGGQIFKEALEKNLVDKLYLTLVKGDFNADIFFPEYSGFNIQSEEKGESNGIKYTFVNLVKSL